MDYRSKCRTNLLKILKDHVGRIFHEVWLEDWFINMKTKGIIKNNQYIDFNIFFFCSMKDPGKRMKRQAANLEETFANCIPDKGLRSIINFLKISKLNKNKMNYLIKKWAKK